MGGRIKCGGGIGGWTTTVTPRRRKREVPRSEEMTAGDIGDPAPTHSRSGRELQRYGPEGERLVAGTIPVRSRGGGEEVEVLMVRAQRQG